MRIVPLGIPKPEHHPKTYEPNKDGAPPEMKLAAELVEAMRKAERWQTVAYWALSVIALLGVIAAFRFLAWAWWRW